MLEGGKCKKMTARFREIFVWSILGKHILKNPKNEVFGILFKV